jgi:hypothetical protein
MLHRNLNNTAAQYENGTLCCRVARVSAIAKLRSVLDVSDRSRAF